MRYIILVVLLTFIYSCGGGSSSGDSNVVNGSETWWQPKAGITWQIQLMGDLNTSYDVAVYDIDLFDTPQATIDALQDRGVKIVCYFSAGSYEDWRDDEGDFPAAVIGKPLDGWAGENWLDVSNTDVLMPIMESRMDVAVAKGCDAVDPDNVDGYTNDTGFSLTYADQLAYNLLLAEAAHERGLAIGLKNDLNQIGDLVDVYDFTVNEQCFQYDECDLLVPFINADKPVFGIEYELTADQFCADSVTYGFSTLLMDYDLDGGRYSCN